MKSDRKCYLQLLLSEFADIKSLRLSRVSARLQCYDISLVHEPGKTNTVAVTFSGLPVENQMSISYGSFLLNALFCNLVAFMKGEVADTSQKDSNLQTVHQFVMNG